MFDARGIDYSSRTTRTLDSGRVIRRELHRCQITGQWHPTWHDETPPQPDAPKGPPMAPWSFIRSPGTRFQEDVLACRLPTGRHTIDLREPSDTREEIESLRRLGFDRLVEIVLKANPPKARKVDPSVLFNPGDTLVFHALLSKRWLVDNEEMLGYLDRHIRGDAGVQGTLDGYEPSDDEKYAPALFSILAQNYAAIADGHGIVRSLYPLPPRSDRRMHGQPVPEGLAIAPPARPNHGHVQFVTLLAAGHHLQTVAFETA